MLRWSFVSIAILAVIISSDAVSQQTFQELETVSHFQQALAAVDAIKIRKKLQCVLAIASQTLCECLSRKLTVDTYPRSYASIAKQENEYERLPAADKNIVDQCVTDSR
jgi:hypothetical protein